MAKIFDVNTDVHESPNRNTFDLTHKRHMTGKAGVIYPFFCQPVVPTDSFEIDTAIGANLMPMWYPTQSNMRFIVHYFYVPNRIMYKGWKNAIEGIQSIPEDFPYINQPASFYKTGSLADYLGIPTNFILPESTSITYSVVSSILPRVFSIYVDRPSGLIEDNVIERIYDGLRAKEEFNFNFRQFSVSTTASSSQAVGIISRATLLPMSTRTSILRVPINASSNGDYMFLIFDNKNYQLNDDSSVVRSPVIGPQDIKYIFKYGFGTYEFSSNHSNFTVDTADFNAAVSQCDDPCIIFLCCPEIEDSLTYTPYSYFDIASVGNSNFNFSYLVSAGTDIEISGNNTFCPYYSNENTEDTVKISAFPFRAYDMVYNSFYRNSQGVQPLMKNGYPLYNEYLLKDDGGADGVNYELKSRNWELDAYTSCLPSPQQGDAPIISVDSLGRMRIQDEDGTTSTLELRDLDGEQGVEVKNVDIANPEHARLAMRMATSGLTIADFRQGNALQRFLEQSLRSGYRYADFIFGHFGKGPSHQELDMPIFLGGYTQNIDVSKVSNVSASGTAPLGEFAGVGASFGGAKHNIKHYFDDYGWVIGVMMLVPDPAYSQILPKPFTYSSRLDWYFPQFAQLGMQSVTYEEVCPIQSHYQHSSDSSKLLTDTFGYQRPNHEYVWYPDTLHGLFRTSLNGSVVNRRFGNRPVLGDNFLKIKPEEVNDIFSVTEKNDDIFIAQIVVDIKATRPIPRVVVPSLGR